MATNWRQIVRPSDHALPNCRSQIARPRSRDWFTISPAIPRLVHRLSTDPVSPTPAPPYRALSACQSIFTPDRPKRRDALPAWSSPSASASLLTSPRAGCVPSATSSGALSPGAGYLLRAWSAMASPYVSPSPRGVPAGRMPSPLQLPVPSGVAPVMAPSPRCPVTPGRGAVPFPIASQRSELQRWLQQAVARASTAAPAATPSEPAPSVHNEIGAANPLATAATP